jgi:hypothetical protein
MVITLCTAAIAYPLLVKLFPEPPEVYAYAEPVATPAVAIEA